MSVLNTLAAGGCSNRRNRIICYSMGSRQSIHALADLDEKARLLAARFRAEGLRRGERIGVLAKNSLEWVLLDLAAIKAGIVTAGFETGRFAPSPELLSRYALRRLYTDGAAEYPGIVDIRTVAPRAGEADACAAPAPRYAPAEVITLKFTSGSTGEPKGLGATAGSIDASLEAVQAMFQHRDPDNILVFLPLSLLQQRYWIYSALVYGHDVTVATYESVFTAARESAPTVVMGVPGFFDTVKRRVEADMPPGESGLTARREGIYRLLGPRIRYLWTGSAPASLDTLKFFNDCGVPLYEGYGMNETCIVSKNHPGAFRLGSVGKVLPNKRVRLDDDGVLIVGSDFPVNVRYAYCGAGENERIFLPGGDVRTGDLARIDPDGFLYILGRADDTVVLGNGKNVLVRPIEEKVKLHGAIEECVLYGTGKPYLVAVVSPARLPADAQAIQDHVDQINGELADHQRIRRVLIAPERFSADNGLLTSQYKPKRKEIYRRLEGAIENAYGERT